MTLPALSVAIVCYDMARALPRTVYSLSRSFQRGMQDIPYEIIVIDNGSDDLPPVPEVSPRPLLRRARVVSKSPVGAMNEAIDLARAPLVGAWIDGARMASPGLLRAALAAAEPHGLPVIATPNYQLGPERQLMSVAKGYDTATEDRLLAQAGWPHGDADLFSISTCELAELTGPMLESNALFLRAAHWRRLGGFDPAFADAGGGAANPDVLTRALATPGAQLIRLVDEGTFHQVHGGVTTFDQKRGLEAVKRASREYAALRGHPPTLVRTRGRIFRSADGRFTFD